MLEREESDDIVVKFDRFYRRSDQGYDKAEFKAWLAEREEKVEFRYGQNYRFGKNSRKNH